LTRRQIDGTFVSPIAVTGTAGAGPASTTGDTTTMAVDLTGGLDPARELVFADQPDDPEMRESVNAWIWDRSTEFGLPRIGVEAVADQWDTHDVQFHVTFADGRIYSLFAPGKAHGARDADGTPRTLGAGPLAFEVVEPFRRWRVRFDGLAIAGSVQDEMAGRRGQGEPDTPIVLDLDLVAAVPPWENGTLLPEAKRVLEEQDEGALMGGPRFEQLNRATGTLQVGDEQQRIDGGALRIRRQGVRRLATFRGHAWQSALFPSGRGFGFIVYPPRDDGLPTYNEGYVFPGDGALVPARVLDAPWLRRLQPDGEAVSVVLDTPEGTATITGETIASSFAVIPTSPGAPVLPVLQQAIVRYRWDDEVANGMMERSIPADQLAS
jgi:hypothetical protein